tara:strand:+ start:578 stop:1684 length:1107 start_codon:yes stop_codon:yes gene_type:complete
VSIFLVITLSDHVAGIAGVTPASYEVDFKPNLKGSFDFNFIFDEGVEAEIYVSDFFGDMGQYASVNKEKLVGGGKVTAYLRLPAEAEEPGVHVIRIHARQLPSEVAGLALIANVGGIIKVKVPYPGKYATLELRAENANVGESVEVKLKIYNKGKEMITIFPILVVSNGNGEVEKLSYEAYNLATTEDIELTKMIDTSDYLAGDYNLTAIVEYGGDKPAQVDSVFRLGELYLGISNYTKSFEQDKIERFEVEVESFWNDAVKGVYANVSVLDSELSFLTPSIDIAPWRKGELVGFLDTSEIESGRFKANISVYYEGKITSKIVDLKLRVKIDKDILIIGGLVAAIVVLLAVIFLVLRKRKVLNLRRGK